jgi:hypothetical protein
MVGGYGNSTNDMDPDRCTTSGSPAAIFTGRAFTSSSTQIRSGNAKKSTALFILADAGLAG